MIIYFIINLSPVVVKLNKWPTLKPVMIIWIYISPRIDRIKTMSKHCWSCHKMGTIHIIHLLSAWFLYWFSPHVTKEKNIFRLMLCIFLRLVQSGLRVCRTYLPRGYQGVGLTWWLCSQVEWFMTSRALTGIN